MLNRKRISVAALVEKYKKPIVAFLRITSVLCLFYTIYLSTVHPKTQLGVIETLAMTFSIMYLLYDALYICKLPSNKSDDW